jgi:ascorbate-specific PTS system EIIC-type component UlaA
VHGLYTYFSPHSVRMGFLFGFVANEKILAVHITVEDAV